MTLEDAESEIEDMNNKRYLENHKCNIWQGTDGRWRTYLSDHEQKSKLKMIVKLQETENHIVYLYPSYS